MRKLLIWLSNGRDMQNRVAALEERVTALELAELTRAADMQRVGGALLSIQATIDTFQTAAKGYVGEVMTHLKELRDQGRSHREKASTKLEVLEARVLQLERMNADDIE